MRFHLKKTLTWMFAVVCFVLATFNFYNQQVWLHTSGSKPWGKNFHEPSEHNRIHRPFKVVQTFINGTSGGQKQQTHAFVTVGERLSTAAPTKAPKVLWPDKVYFKDDRILNQLAFKAPAIDGAARNNNDIPLKKILLWAGIGGWQVKRGRQTFIDQKCNINTCELTDKRTDAETADGILFHHSPQRPMHKRPLHQIWMLFMLESPYHTPGLSAFPNVLNWTATYRHDSDITAPYEKFVPWDENITIIPQNKSYAAGKTKKVAWFVSNCGARNARREYVNELSKHINVDIYGACGTMRCPRSDSKRCFSLLDKEYKFYLSFENSNCRDYITEKFFVNGLMHDVIPIVMGAAPEDYERSAPPHSFIHVDDFESPEQLAKYLHKLDKDDDLYNEYFRWKGTGRLIDTLFWCRICGMLHETTREPHSYRDLEKWWRGDGVCIGKDNWRQHPRTSTDIVENYLMV